MGKVTKLECTLSNIDIERKIKETTGFWRVQKWLIIYNAKNYPRKAEDIAKHLNVSRHLVHKTIFEFKKNGVQSIETAGKGGRKNCYMSVEEELSFLSKYFESAKFGQIATVSEIKAGFEEKIGKIVNKTTIYRLLKRHNWRKIVPRSQHPKADVKLQEDFKKNI